MVVSVGWGHRPNAAEKSIIILGSGPVLRVKTLNEKNRA